MRREKMIKKMKLNYRNVISDVAKDHRKLVKTNSKSERKWPN